MEIRLFDLNNDFDVMKAWISDERTHMLWCANRIQFPMSISAFEDENIEAVHLNVFSANTRARICYEKVGFVERNVTKDAFHYMDESWDRCNMIIKRQSEGEEVI